MRSCSIDHYNNLLTFNKIQLNLIFSALKWKLIVKTNVYLVMAKYFYKT